MTTDTASLLVGEGWHDGLEAGVRGRIRGFIEELLEEELIAALGRARYARSSAWLRSKRIGHQRIGCLGCDDAGRWPAADVTAPVTSMLLVHVRPLP